MFHVVARHFELIFCLLTTPKLDLRVVQKAMFQGLASYLGIIFDLLTISIKRLIRARESDVSSRRQALRTFIQPLVQPKMRIGSCQRSVVSSALPPLPACLHYLPCLPASFALPACLICLPCLPDCFSCLTCIPCMPLCLLCLLVLSAWLASTAWPTLPARNAFPAFPCLPAYPP